MHEARAILHTHSSTCTHLAYTHTHTVSAHTHTHTLTEECVSTLAATFFVYIHIIINLRTYIYSYIFKLGCREGQPPGLPHI